MSPDSPLPQLPQVGDDMTWREQIELVYGLSGESLATISFQQYADEPSLPSSSSSIPAVFSESLKASVSVNQWLKSILFKYLLQYFIIYQTSSVLLLFFKGKY